MFLLLVFYIYIIFPTIHFITVNDPCRVCQFDVDFFIFITYNDILIYVS